jgi:hypothetical protein
MSYYGKTYFLEKQVAQVWLDTTELANRLFITAIGTISSSFEHVDGISVCVSAHVNGPKRPGKYGHRETPILRHAFFIAVAEMPSFNAAIGSERLVNCSRISTLIETGARSTRLRLGNMTVSSLFEHVDGISVCGPRPTRLRLGNMTVSSSFEHVDGISVRGPKHPGKYGHRETPILRHAFFIAVAEMPSLNAAIGSERLTNCSRISTVIETGTRVWPSILRLGITVQTVSGVPVVNITFTNNERFKV